MSLCGLCFIIFCFFLFFPVSSFVGKVVFFFDSMDPRFAVNLTCHRLAGGKDNKGTQRHRWLNHFRPRQEERITKELKDSYFP